MKLPTTGGRYVVKRGKPRRIDEADPAPRKTPPKETAESKPATSEDEA